MATTSPDNIWTPDSGDDYALTTDLAATADTIQDALTRRANYYVGDSADMAAQEANAPEGAVFYNTDDNTEYRMESGSWSSGGSGTTIKYFRWADATERAAQTGMVAGDLGYQTDNAVVYRYTGSAWKAWESDWIAYTPVLTNFTIGTGGAATNTAQYRYNSGRVQVKGRATLGTSGASVGTSVSLTLPVTRAALSHNWQGTDGVATSYDDSAGVNYFAFVAATLSSVTAVTLLHPGTNGARVAINPTSPFTWAAGDTISYDFEYDPA